MTPLRLAYYAYLLVGGIRLLLNYLFRRSYNQYDLTVAVFTSVSASYLASLNVICLIVLAFVFDLEFVVRPHPRVAPMLVDLLVLNNRCGKEAKTKNDIVIKAVLPADRSTAANVAVQVKHSSPLSAVSSDAQHQGFSVSSLRPQLMLNWCQSVFYRSSCSSSISSLINTALPRSSARPLVHFRSFSRTTRNRLARYDYNTERFLVFSLPLDACLLTGGSGYYIVISIWPIYRSVWWFQMILYFVDLSVILAIFMYTFKIALFFYKLLPFVCYAWRLHVKEITGKAFKRPVKISAATAVELKNKRLFRQKSCPNNNNRFITSVSIKANYFMKEHTNLIIDLLHFNRHFASVLIFWYYMPLLFSSIFILCVLYFLPVVFIIKVHFFAFFCRLLLNIVTILTSQVYHSIIYLLMIGSYVILGSLSAVIKVLYTNGADEEMYRAQINSKNSGNGNRSSNALLRTKLKLMFYYEVLKTKKKVTFTFGPHARVENKWLLEVNMLKT